VRRGRYAALLAATALSVSFIAIQGGGTANASQYDQYTAAPTGEASVPLPDDVILNYASGQPIASHYKFSYVCPTEPTNKLGLPDNVGVPGADETRDFTQYQSAPCYFGVPQANPTEAPLPVGEINAAFHNVRELYGLAPWFEGVPGVGGQLNDLYGANTPISQIQANCPRQGLPVTGITDPVGSCLMHMNVLHFPNDNGAADPQYHVPNQVPLPAHSHILGGLVSSDTSGGAWGRSNNEDSPTRLGPTWWHPRSVQVLDRSIWPDAAGNCPAGRVHCLTSMKALREAQAKGQARPEGGSNILLYFSVQPISKSGQNTLRSVSLNNADGSVNVAGRKLWAQYEKKNAVTQNNEVRARALSAEVAKSAKAPARQGATVPSDKGKDAARPEQALARTER
jgi:hypothetical protein